MPRVNKYPVPRTVPLICRVFRRRILTRTEWRLLGRPDWVICGVEKFRAGRGGGLSPRDRHVFYRTSRPAYLDLDAIVHTTDYTVRLEVGTTTEIGLHFVECEPEAVELVEPDQADARVHKYSKSTPQLWWARGLSAFDVQEYQIGE